MSFWGVVQTEPRRERIARIWLMREGYETYAPRTFVKVGKAGKIVLLFPSYIFVRIVERWYPVTWTPGVLRLLMANESPAILPDNIVALIRKREDRDGLVRLPRAPGFQRGQSMVITAGAFAGRFAVYRDMSGAERSKVLLNMLGGAVEVELPTGALHAADVSSAPTRT